MLFELPVVLYIEAGDRFEAETIALDCLDTARMATVEDDREKMVWQAETVRKSNRFLSIEDVLDSENRNAL